MRLFSLLVLFLSTLYLSGCYEALSDDEIVMENEVSWRGIHSEDPEDPLQNWVYYNSNDGITYIYTGIDWDTMTVNGLDGISLRWIGNRDTIPTAEENLNNAYFNTSDSVSYVYTANGWDTLAISGDDGLSIEWKGTLTADPANPKRNWGYYNSVKQASYIYDGSKWTLISMDGLNGVDLHWLGTYPTAPASPRESDAYYNSSAEMSFIFTGGDWQVICRDGLQGDAGMSLVWKGALDASPANPSENWAYFNNQDRTSYIYNGTSWNVLAQSGKNGADLVWLGAFDVAPDSAVKNSAYFNLTDSISYIYNGSGWDIICTGGENGDDGLDGMDGITIDWRGTYSTAPNNPKENWAYHNTSDGNSYIWDGDDWHVLTQSGANGLSINWMGTKYSRPTYPSKYDAYYDIYSGTSFIYTGTSWDTLARGGKDGSDGQTIVWKGSYPSAPAYPDTNWVYYDTDDKTTFIYNGIGWDVFCKDGVDGYSVKDKSALVRDTIESGDTLVLDHNYNSYDMLFIGQYYVDGNVVRNYSEIPAEWENPFVVTQRDLLYDASYNVQPRKLVPLANGSMIHLFVDTVGVYKGGKYAALSSDGTLGEIETFTTSVISEPDMVELGDGSFAFAYIDETNGNSVKVSFVTGDVKNIVDVEDSSSHNVVLQQLDDTTIAVAYIDNENQGCFRVITQSGIVSDPVVFATSIRSGADDACTFIAQESGTLLFVYQSDDGVYSVRYNSDGTEITRSTLPASEEMRFVSIVELENSNVFVHTLIENSTDMSENYHQSTFRLSQNGVYVDHRVSRPYVYSSQLLARNSSELILVEVQSDHYEGVGEDRVHIGGAPTVVVLDENLQVISANKIEQQISYPEIVVLDENRLAFTSLQKGQWQNVEYGVLEMSSEKPVIELRALTANRTCLINKTGQELEMTLSVYLSRSYDSHAVKAQR